MAEVKVRGEDLSGLGWTIKSLMDGNLERPDVLAKVAKIKGTLVVRETAADVANTIFFNKGETERRATSLQPSPRVRPTWSTREGLRGQLVPLVLLFRRLISPW